MRPLTRWLGLLKEIQILPKTMHHIALLGVSP